MAQTFVLSCLLLNPGYVCPEFTPEVRHRPTAFHEAGQQHGDVDDSVCAVSHDGPDR